MSRRAIHRVLGRLSAPLLAVAIVTIALAGAAFAGGRNTIHVKVPKHARVGAQYAVTVSGHAATTETMYLFLDYRRCGRSPAVEHHRATAYGVYTTVRNTFRDRVGGWTSGSKGQDHACAYLVKASAPRNPSRGVLAHAFASYRIH